MTDIRRKPIRALPVVKNVIIWLLSAIMLIPLLLIVFTAFKGADDARGMSFSLPASWDFGNFAEVIDKGNLGAGFLNSLLYSGLGSVLTVLFASMAAFVLSRRRSRGNRFLYMFIVMGLVLPINFVALTKVMQTFELNDTRVGIILLYTAIQLPFIVFLCFGFVARIPLELDEAAVIDGCGPIRLFFLIIFPLMRPVLITGLVLCFLNMWNEFILPLYFLGSADKWPMTLAVYGFFGRYETQWNLIAADVLLTSLPVVIMYFLAQRYIVGGQTEGAVKG
ncbi:carbohydrate ABC transporter permease [Micromonospora sp. D93]|uniref:carbohydrate ABC transporter permease n=1 Tax=Micromonospora sp. D93 TaxID=2824886 RepID=UPI001B368E3D|nr:carbohydrate ABC transporter permease [Micromonospora sp. D93]MBQ1017539.1 carbohydrate ABC transporter permease [Micromonospora sp. D93]